MDLTQFSPSSALLTVVVLALAPFIAVMVTSFTKIVVVLSLLRNALGLQQVPPNVVLNGLALVLSVYVMYPVGQQMAERAALRRRRREGAAARVHGETRAAARARVFPEDRAEGAARRQGRGPHRP